MTVHKSQGSEFNHVILILSEESSDQAVNLLTRELLYTGITRSKDSVTIYTSPETWRQAVARSSLRVSGMRAFLTLG